MNHDAEVGVRASQAEELLHLLSLENEGERDVLEADYSSCWIETEISQLSKDICILRYYRGTVISQKLKELIHF